MAQAPKRGKNEPEPRPIIVKKIIADSHGGHHGGAWKVAYADFVTAMMAFFLLLWILGATTEKQRKGIADYFTPTLVEMRQKSAGSNGPLGGDSIISKDNYPHAATQTGSRSLTIPKDTSGGDKEGASALRTRDVAKFEQIKQAIEKKVASNAKLAKLMESVRMVQTTEGLRIDLIDQSNFAMFASGTDILIPQALELLRQVAETIKDAPNPVMVRGHTDGLPYSKGRSVNNWTLSAARAESTRKALANFGIADGQFTRIEGVADRQPLVDSDPYDPRNRRMSITLGWQDGTESEVSTTMSGAPALAPIVRPDPVNIRPLKPSKPSFDIAPSGSAPTRQIKSDDGLPKIINGRVMVPMPKNVSMDPMRQPAMKVMRPKEDAAQGQKH